MSRQPCTLGRATLAIVVVTASLAACSGRTGHSQLAAVPPSNPGATAPAAPAAPAGPAPHKPAASKPKPKPHNHDHSDHKHPAPKPAPAKPDTSKPAPSTPQEQPAAVHFATAEAAMRYLAATYNRNDQTALAKVTTPAARDALNDMRSIAPSMTFHMCTADSSGAYDCEFKHTYPKGSKGHGWATVRVAPAVRPGWYMSQLLDCS